MNERSICLQRVGCPGEAEDGSVSFNSIYGSTNNLRYKNKRHSLRSNSLVLTSLRFCAFLPLFLQPPSHDSKFAAGIFYPDRSRVRGRKTLESVA